ncbi:MAG: hypothetical protein JNM50_04080 [Chromatiales bacterium]|nr:hypothetical protein [Chromatiales bacterium]
MSDAARQFLSQPRPGAESTPAWADELISDAQLCRLLGISADTLTRMRQRGGFPPPDLRLGAGDQRKKNRTRRSTYLRWLDEARNSTAE